jgi:hypothetical protein
VDLEVMTVEREDLYRKRDPPGAPIPIHLAEPFEIDDTVPSEWEIAEAVGRMPNGKSPGPTKMKAEHLKAWRAEAFPREGGVEIRENRAPFAELVQHVFRTGEIPTAMSYTVCVLLPKADGGVRGLGLLEVVWKIIASILAEHMNSTIKWHDCIHGFRAERGTGTAIIEAKLFQQLALVDQVPVFEIFLDLRKAYDSVDRERTLEQIFEGYGVGPNTRRILKKYWDQMWLVARQADYYGRPFTATRGLTQAGDPLFPTLFNIVVDAIIRAWLASQQNGDDEATEGFIRNVAARIACFYADDGMIGSRDSDWLQHSIRVLAGLFERVGLRTNTTKTEAMTCAPSFIRGYMSPEAHQRNRGVEGSENTYRERKRQRVECSECQAGLAAGSLLQHMRAKHGTGIQSAFVAAEPVPMSYRVSFPKIYREGLCPVDGCSGRAANWDLLRRHFVHRHPEDTLCIMEESVEPLPKCELCRMHVTPSAISRGGHQTSLLCKRGQANSDSVRR